MEFISAFFGCLYAGVVAVPVYPPRRNRSLERLSGIVADCDAAVVLTTAESLALVEKPREDEPRLKALPWVCTDQIPLGLEQEWREPSVASETLAFLQYTSGSTSTPKGVMLTHGNLLANSACISHAFVHGPHTNSVSWLPLYHDMGLIGGVLQPLYVGFPMVLMAPTAFLSAPRRWLQAMSRYRATATVAPNFSYDLCVRRVTEEQKAGLDLSRWEVTATGGEPVHADTIERFTEAFAPCGFRREVFLPCFGLAESSLMATSRVRTGPLTVLSVRKDELTRGRAVVSEPSRDAQTLVGCGRPLLGAEVVIVDPETRRACPEGQVGEIWSRGPSVGQGYWNRPEETSHSFGGRLADSGDGPFLRTGDLGFLHDSELFVTGRIKDLLILYGRNYYPQDIERTTEQSHQAMRQSCGAAFGVHADGEERLIVVQEVEHPARKWNMEEVVASVRRAVSEQHEVSLQTLVLLRMNTIPRTSSGKIQRRACRELFLSGGLDVVHEWTANVEASCQLASDAAGQARPLAPTTEEIHRWLVEQVAQRLSVSADQLDAREPLAHYGLDSSVAVALASETETWLGRRVSPLLIYEHPTIEALARHLSGDESRKRERRTEEPVADACGSRGEPIAIIGIGCRFPGASGPEAFWKLLSDGVDAVREVPPGRWDADAYYDADLHAPGKMNTRWGGFLDQVDQFDAAFFGVSPREAVHVDPQQRLLLEVAYEALEDAGLPPEKLARSMTGVFVGITGNDYGLLRAGSRDGQLYASTGNALCIAANRLSYTFDFRGPSLAVDTACSSSLTAVHLACQSLARGECDLALAGGANLLLAPEVSLHLSKGAVFAPDGRCKTFSAKANGMVRGEGVGVVVLKPLSKALADGDPVYAVIRGTAANQDGRSNGLTAPNQQAQEAMLREAYRRAGVPTTQVDYVEAHGTGTSLGDPIEASALGAVLAEGRPEDRPVAIGSVKTNIGHLEAAAGVAGLIKVALSLRHGAIPASLHFDEPNPLIPFEALRLRVQAQHGEWTSKEGPRTAGVSSFGFGGTNVHVVVQEAAHREPVAVNDIPPPYLLPLSARDPEALAERARTVREWLVSRAGSVSDGVGKDPSLTLPALVNGLRDVCYTATARRAHLDHRAAFVAATPGQLAEQIEAYLQKGQPAAPARQAARVVFVCSGQGPEWGAAGRQLMQTEPVFRDTLHAVDALIRRHASWSLLEELAADPDKSRLNVIDVAQPAQFALQVSLAALWRSWGVEPAAFVGHSMGEVTAAHLSGALPLDEAVRLIVVRGQLLHRLSGRGAMAAVELTAEGADKILRGYEGRLEVAAINDPTSIVLSGEPDAVAEVLARLEKQGVFCKRLRQTVAGHSVQMDPLRADLEQQLAGLAPLATSRPFYSTVTGQLEVGVSLDAGYWGRNLRQPVRFFPALERLVGDGYRAFVELSPHASLCSIIQGALTRGGQPGIAVASLRRGEDERGTMLSALAGLYPFGVEINWDRLCPRRGNCVRLPAYPWQRERFWLVPEPHRTDFPHAGENGCQANGRAKTGHADETAGLLYERTWLPRSLPGLALIRPSADYLANPRTIEEELRSKALRLGAEAGLDRLADAEPLVNALAAAYVVQALSALGVPVEPGKRFAMADLAVPAQNHRLLGRLLEMLRQDGALLPDGDGWAFTDACRNDDPAELKKTLLDCAPGAEAELALLDQCAVHLASVLRGETDPLGVIFPGGNAAAVERVHRDSPTARVYNALAREAVAKALLALPAGRTVRVLEVGAGTGGLTQALLPGLPAGQTEYVFTDVSAVFTARAEKTFAQYPFVRYETLDAERDPAGQGFARGQFDLVVAANVFHATADLRVSLRHARELLAPGGMLLLLEVTRPQRWLDLVFGLTEGWWRFHDTDLRPDHPLLSAAKWQALFAEVGFTDAASLAPSAGGEPAQSVLLARNGANAPAAREPATTVSGTFVILADRGGVGARLAERLTAGGGRCDVVMADQADNLGLMLQDVSQAGIAPAVIHLWSLDTPVGGPEKLDDVLAEQGRGGESLLPVLREMLQGEWAESPRLWVVTRGAQPVAGEITDAGLVHAPLVGLGRVLAQEQPGAFGGLIDLPPEVGADECVAALLSELGRRSLENEVAYRHGQRFVARLTRRPAAAPSPHWHAQTNGTYLVTGGLGDLGLQVARWLADQGARRLLLVGRTPLPARRLWSAADPDSRVGRQVAAIRELEARGVHVHLASVDVADEVSLRTLLDDFRAEGWPALRGVVHVAGVEQEKTLGLLEAADLRDVLRPKLLGGWLLDRLLGDEPLDLFVLFSSGASLLGSPGMGSYVAANSFLDALAHRRRARGQAALSVNWGPWEGLGMATVAGRASRFALHGVGHITADQAFHALDDLLAQKGCAQAGVMAMDWPELLRSYPSLAQSPLLRPFAGEVSKKRSAQSVESALTRETLLATDPERRHEVLAVYVASQAARVLGLPARLVDMHQPLNTLGLDSLMAVELKNHLDSRFNVFIPVRALLGGTNLHQLVDLILAPLDAPAPAGVGQAADQDEYPLSHGQWSLWFLNQLAPADAAYNVAFAVGIRSTIDVPALTRTIQHLVDRHPSLRTTYSLGDGKPTQRVHGRGEFVFAEIDAASFTQEELDRRLVEEAHKPLDLANGPVLHASLYRREESSSVLLLVLHHIATDFWSLQVLLGELRVVYPAALSGSPVPLAPTRASYADFVRWQSEMLTGPEGIRHWDYWRQSLGGELPILNLPTDLPRSQVMTFNGATQPLVFDEGLTLALRSLARSEGATLYTVLLAAFQVLLYRWTSQEDIIVGSPLNGRTREEFGDVFGYFVNPVPMRASLGGGPSFRDFLGQVREVVLGALEHQDFPAAVMVERLQVPRDPGRSPLFQTLFVLDKPHRLGAEEAAQFVLGEAGGAVEVGGLQLESYPLPHEASMFDVVLFVVEGGDTVSGHLQYNTDLFRPETMARMAGHLQTLLSAFVTDPALSVDQAPLLTKPELALFDAWNDTARDYPRGQCLHELIEEQAARRPETDAVVCGGDRLSYSELDRRANRLAWRLREVGVGPEVLVGVHLDKSVDMVVGVLGVLKAGGAYVPLDPAYPAERLRLMLDDSGARVVLTRGAAGLTTAARVISLDDDREWIASASDEGFDSGARPENLAYVLFSSGSTGSPKGSMIPHSNVVNQYWAWEESYRLRADTASHLQMASFSFDVCTGEMVRALCSGKKLVLVPRDLLLDPPALFDTMRLEGVDTGEFVPAVLRNLARYVEGAGRDLSFLRLLMVGSDAWFVQEHRQVLRLCGPRTRFVNSYGLTEVTIDSLFYEGGADDLRPDGMVPIGRLFGNTRAYILDAHRQRVPVGVAGELYLAGPGVARGYLNHPEQTAERFLPDPFRPDAGTKLYRTGDLTRWRPDGNVEFLGRLDQQVKLRGFRIELGDIESALVQAPGVRGCAVIIREDAPGARRLVAYVVSESNSADLRNFLRSRLPEYMVPAVFVPLERLPLTANGKVDRQALPVPDAAQQRGSAYVRPRTPTEETLCAIWQELLGVDRVGVHDNFFELGGESILAIQFITRASQEGLRVTPRQLFRSPTVAELAEECCATTTVDADQGVVVGPVPLTPIQRWFFDLEVPRPDHFNQALLLEVRHRVDPALLRESIRHLMRHHDALRLRFRRQEEGWSQEIGEPSDDVPVRFVDLSADENPTAAIEAETARLQLSLDLAEGSLLRVAYFDLGPSRPGRLFLTVHHLAIDAVSWRILVADLQAVYAQLGMGQEPELQAKTTSWKRWAERLHDLANSPDVLAEADHWLAASRKAAATRVCPLDHPESGAADNTVASSGTVEVKLEADETRVLMQQVPAANGTQVHDVLVSALAVTLQDWTGSAEIGLSLEGHGREELVEDVDLSRTVGWFTTLYPVFLDLGGAGNAVAALPMVSEQLKRIPRRGIGYGLLRYLGSDQQAAAALGDLPHPEVSLNYLGTLDQVFPESSPFALAAESIGQAVCPSAERSHLLEVIAYVRDGQLHVVWSYGTTLHRRDTVTKLAEQFLDALRDVIASCVHGPAHRNGENGHAANGDGHALAASFFAHTRTEQRPLAQLIAEGKLPPVDSAALGYLPGFLVGSEGLSPEMITRDWFGNAPFVTTIQECSLGRIAGVWIPRFDFQLYQDQDDLVEQMIAALALAGRMGARCASLTGLLPSATDYGRAVARRAEGMGLPAITTGHATTTATVVLTIGKTLSEAGRDLQGEHVGFLGLGSIGVATLRLLLSSQPHPAELTLCDVVGKRAFLQQLHGELREKLGFRGKIHLVESKREASEELYRATLIVGATNAPDVLDVRRMRPGALLVDDSWPHAFRPDVAAERLRTRGDILYTEGGVLRAPEPIRQVLYLPPLLEQVLPVRLGDWAVRLHPEQITGCVLGGLLSAVDDQLPPTLGFIEAEGALLHHEALARLGYDAAPLHCDETLLDPAQIQGFRQKFGHSEAAL